MAATEHVILKWQVIGTGLALFWKSYDATFHSLDDVFNENMQLDARESRETKMKIMKTRFSNQSWVKPQLSMPASVSLIFVRFAGRVHI